MAGFDATLRLTQQTSLDIPPAPTPEAPLSYPPIPIAWILCLAFVAACGKTDSSRAGDSPPPGQSEGTLVEYAVEPAMLWPFLPESYLGQPRGEVEEDYMEFQGDTSTNVAAEYRGTAVGAYPPVSIRLWDYGASAYMLRTAQILEMEHEERIDGGIVRHTKFRGYPVSEREVRSVNTIESNLQILVARRFLVDIEGHGVTLDQLRAGAADLNLDELARLGGPK